MVWKRIPLWNSDNLFASDSCRFDNCRFRPQRRRGYSGRPEDLPPTEGFWHGRDHAHHGPEHHSTVARRDTGPEPGVRTNRRRSRRSFPAGGQDRSVGNGRDHRSGCGLWTQMSAGGRSGHDRQTRSAADGLGRPRSLAAATAAESGAGHSEPARGGRTGGHPGGKSRSNEGGGGADRPVWNTVCAH